MSDSIKGTDVPVTETHEAAERMGGPSLPGEPGWVKTVTGLMNVGPSRTFVGDRIARFKSMLKEQARNSKLFEEPLSGPLSIDSDGVTKTQNPDKDSEVQADRTTRSTTRGVRGRD